MTAKDNVTIGIEWQFGPDWQANDVRQNTPGHALQAPANKRNGRCRLHGGQARGLEQEPRKDCSSKHDYWSAH